MYSLVDFNTTPGQGFMQALLILMVGIAGAILGGILTSKAKRMIYSTSLYIHIMRVDLEHIDKVKAAKQLSDIDGLLNLVHKEERALMVPFLLHDRIWHNVDIPTVPDLVDVDHDFESNHILMKTPKWLLYSANEMRIDTLTILRKLSGNGIRPDKRTTVV